jgi:acyl-coenzyme A synthetase/AMP-(fatty) acid ligase
MCICKIVTPTEETKLNTVSNSKLLCVSLLTGEAIVAFATATESNTEGDDELVKELRTLVRSEIGPFAAPDVICITPSLPMVR